MTLTKEQALIHLKAMREGNVEVLNFALKHDKAQLYRAAEIDIATLDVAIVALEEDLKGPQT